MTKNTKLLLWLGILASVIYVACRKMDNPTSQPVQKTGEERFFNARQSDDPVMQIVTNYLQRKNETLHFVDRTIKQIGYPYWDKAIITKMASATHRSAGDSNIVVYVPFVRDSQTYVNASLVVKMTSADTSFNYLCDWQYSQMPNTPASPVDSAERFALFLMVMDNAVFGHRDFAITDPQLFTYNGNTVSSVHITLLNQTGRYGQSNVMAASVPACINAALNLTGCVNCGNVTTQQCWNEYYGVNTNGTGGGSGGGSGGGGSSGGGGTPPSCTGTGCGTGWIPVSPTGCNPFISTLAGDSAFKNRFKALNTPQATNNGFESGYAVFDRATSNYSYVEGSAFNPLITWNIPSPVEGLLHCHYNGLNNIFSADDILFMAQIYLAGFAKDSANLFFGMTSHSGLPYLVKVSNTARFRTFAERIVAMEANNNGFTKKYNQKLNSGSNNKNIEEFFNMLQKLGGLSALSVYEATPDNLGSFNFDGWKKLNPDGNGGFNPPTFCND